jgi:hypothetical protein
MLPSGGASMPPQQAAGMPQEAPAAAPPGMPSPQPSAPQAAAAPSGPGLLGRLAGTGGLVGGFANFLNTAAGGQASNPQQQAYQLLLSRGVDPQTARLAVSSPETFQHYAQSLLKPQSRALTAEEKTKLGLPGNAPWFMGADGKPALPEGYAGTLPKTEKVGPGEKLYQVPTLPGAEGSAPKAIVDGGPEKPPSGYEWNDPKNPAAGMRAIAGGPATQIPTEAAGRLAAIDTVMPNFAKTRNELERDWGATDYAKWYANGGNVARARREISVAVEGLLRANTGAAATPEETARYLDFYMPAPTDSKETARQKLGLLQSQLEHIKGNIMQGRNAAPAQGEGWRDVGGGVRIREKK